MSLRTGKDEIKRERRVVSGWGKEQTQKRLSAVKRSLWACASWENCRVTAEASQPDFYH